MKAVSFGGERGRKEVDWRGGLRYGWRLESMAFRHSYSWAGLALACGCCLLAPQAGAGDKIEFSSPAIFWGVPQPEAEQKDNKTEPLSVHLLPYQSKVLYPVVGQSSVNISRRRGADKHTWDSSLSPDSERKDLSGFDRLSPLDGPERATNNWGRPNGRNPGFSGGLEPRNNGDPTEPANGAASQDEASKAFGRDENRNEGLFGDRFTDSRRVALDARLGQPRVDGVGSVAARRVCAV